MLNHKRLAKDQTISVKFSDNLFPAQIKFFVVDISQVVKTSGEMHRIIVR